MSNNYPKQKKLINKQNTNYLSSKNNKTSKRANSQKKYPYSPDIITQIPSPNIYSNNFYSKQANNLNLNLNLLHQQALTPINRRNKLYEEEFLLPEKSSKYEGKKTLVLDIDETLVHSSFFPFEKNDLILNVNFDGIFYNIYVLVRPGTEQFIKNLSKFFEIITFTASIPAYASPLLDILDKERNIQHRLYREHCTFINGVFIKDLKRLNRNLKDVIIVDNSPLAFAFDTDNGLPILSWFDDPIDNELANIQPLLEFLSNTKDVRKYIKKFVKNNIINYDMAYRIIKENKDGKKSKNKKDNTNNKDNNNTNNINIINNKNKIDNIEKINNICIVANDIKKEQKEQKEKKDKKENKENKENNNNNIKNTNINNNNNEKDEEKNSLTNSININNSNKKKDKLLNNFIIKNDIKSPVLINDSLKNNNINNNVNNKIKNKLTNKVNNKLNIINNTNNSKENKSNNLKLEFSNNIIDNKASELNKKILRNNKSSKNSVKNLNKKNNIFRLGIKINDNNNNNNIISINNNFSPQLIFSNKINSNLENDYKINDNILMPIIFSTPPNTSKNKNYHIQYDNIKNKNEKIMFKPTINDNFLKNKNSQNLNNINNINNVQSLSLKETLEDKYNSVKQYKYINLIEKFQDNKNKSSSLKILNKNKEDVKFKNNINNNGENSHRTTKYKLKTNKNNTNVNNHLRISSKPKISSIINKGFSINNAVNRNKMNDIYSQALRSKSTGNFVKLKSAHVKTPKNSINQFKSNNLKWFNEEENKIFLKNNNNDKNNLELLPITGFTPKNLKLANN